LTFIPQEANNTAGLEMMDKSDQITVGFSALSNLLMWEIGNEKASFSSFSSEIIELFLMSVRVLRLTELCDSSYSMGTQRLDTP
jgi:hypothetical protein